MKSYDRLYERLFFESNTHAAANEITQSDRIRRIMKQRCWNTAVVASYLPEWLEHPEIYLTVKHEPTYRWDKSGKKFRTIYVPTIEELAIQHAVVQVLWPVITHGAFENAYGAMPKRGPHKAKKMIERWIEKDPGGCKHCSKSDIYHFYASVIRDRMFALCQKHIKDPRFLNILYYLIYSPSTDEGLLLGNYSSGPLAMWYLQDFDHFVTQVLKPKHYIRWADDIVAFDSNERRLKAITDGMNSYLNTIGLKLKPNFKIFRFSYISRDGTEKGTPLDFMGFEFHRNRTVLRKSIMLSATRCAKHIHKKPWPTIYDALRMESFKGWLKATNTHDMATKHIYPYISFRRLEHKISRKAKETNRYKYYKLVYPYTSYSQFNDLDCPELLPGQFKISGPAKDGINYERLKLHKFRINHQT